MLQQASEADWEVVESYNIVGDNYFCNTGMAILNVVVTQTAVLLTLDRGSTQCSTSDIEVRVCADEGTGNEDSPVELIDIYAK